MKLSEIEKLLPVVYQRSLNPANPMYALLDVMERLHAPSEQVLQKIDTYFDHNTTPERFVRYLAEWVDLGRYLGDESSDKDDFSPKYSVSIEPGRLRELIAIASRLSQWRGTAKGMKLFLETATGVSGFSLEEITNNDNVSSKVFHFSVKAPIAAARYQNLITKIINEEKPAYVTYELAFVPEKEGEEE